MTLDAACSYAHILIVALLTLLLHGVLYAGMVIVSTMMLHWVLEAAGLGGGRGEVQVKVQVKV